MQIIILILLLNTILVGLMESMKAVDSLNPEQFADLASSLNNFFNKITNEQQQVPYSSHASNPSSSATTSKYLLASCNDGEMIPKKNINFIAELNVASCEKHRCYVSANLEVNGVSSF